MNAFGLDFSLYDEKFVIFIMGILYFEESRAHVTSYTHTHARTRKQTNQFMLIASMQSPFHKPPLEF